MDYSTSMNTMNAESAATLGFTMMIFGFIMMILGIFMLVCMWKLFVKAGYEGWKCLIPIYNVYCLFEMSFGNGWLVLLCLIPFVGFVMMVLMWYKLAKAFGKGVGFTIGLLFLSVVFVPILAFDRSEYQGIG